MLILLRGWKRLGLRAFAEYQRGGSTSTALFAFSLCFLIVRENTILQERIMSEKRKGNLSREAKLDINGGGQLSSSPNVFL